MELYKTRRSLFNVVVENLTEASRNTPLHRLFYAAEHFLQDDQEKLRSLIEEAVSACNKDYYDDVTTGLFLYYNSHFIVMIESSEESITKHLQVLVAMNETQEFMGRAKVIMMYHHITQRFFPRWVDVHGRPPTLLTKLNPSCDTEQLGNLVMLVFKKMYNLAGHLRERLDISAEELREAISTVSEKCASFLPEIAIVEFLLSHEDIPELRDHAGLYNITDFKKTLEESVWPIPCDFVPYNVLEEEEQD